MRIEFDDEEYPELSRYLENPKRKMKFLYFLEELFTENNYDPMIDGLQVKTRGNTRGGTETDVQEVLKAVFPYLDNITSALTGLSKNMEGSVIGRFPTEHIVHETVEAPKAKEKKEVEMDDTDYSSMEGIDFTQALAMFEE